MDFARTTGHGRPALDHKTIQGRPRRGVPGRGAISASVFALLVMAAFLISCSDEVTQGRPPGTQATSTLRIRSVIPDMVLIEGGDFLFGSPITDRSAYEYHEEEKPQQKIRVDGFYLARFLVTVEEFCEFLNERGDDGYIRCFPKDWRGNVDLAPAGSYRPRDKAARSPVHGVTWKGATAYTAWLAEKTKLPLRLPTQEEWEFAARGSELRAWPWGKEAPDIKRTIRSARLTMEPVPFYDGYGNRWIYQPYDADRPINLAPVGSFPRNATPDGVHDLVGYYWGQWCSDACKAHNGPGRIVRGDHQKGTNVTEQQVYDEKKKAKGILDMTREPSMPQHHDGRTWSRFCGSEQDGVGLLRLAMDASAAQQAP